MMTAAAGAEADPIERLAIDLFTVDRRKQADDWVTQSIAVRNRYLDMARAVWDKAMHLVGTRPAA